eukprot:6214351-Pleurochrysis_carterae.AAC.1
MCAQSASGCACVRAQASYVLAGGATGSCVRRRAQNGELRGNVVTHSHASARAHRRVCAV